MAVQVGLQCGTSVSKYPGIDAISIRSTLLNGPSPSDRVEIAAVAKACELVLQAVTTLAPLPPVRAHSGASITDPAFEKLPQSASFTVKDGVHRDLWEDCAVGVI